MSKSKGNVMDPLGAHRRVRRRRAALHAGRDGRAGPRHQALDQPRRGLPQLRDQAVERGALRRDERVRAPARTSIPSAVEGDASTAGSSARCERAAAAVTAGIEAYKFNEAAGAVYEFVWGTFCDWYLELTKPMLDRRRRGGQGRDARHRRLGARPDPEAAASVHAVHHRGAVGAHWSRTASERENLLCLDAVAGARRAGRRRGRRGDRLGRAARQRGPLGALGDERAGRRQDPAGAGRRRQGRARSAPSGTRTPSSGSRALDGIAFAKAAPKGAAQIVLGETTAALPLAGVIDMGAERARLEREIEKCAGRDRQDRRQARQRELRGQGAARGGGGEPRAQGRLRGDRC